MVNRNGRQLMKTVGVVLTLALTVSLYAGGVFADTNCGADCCRQIDPAGIHRTKSNPIKLSGSCHFSFPRIPCDLQSKHTVDGSEFALVPSNGGFSNHSGPIEISVDSIVDDDLVEPNGFIQMVKEKPQPHPIYLQIRSLLI